MDELAVSPDKIYEIYHWALGCLLHSGRITVATFGLSKRGKEQLDELTAAFRPVPEDPRITEYKQFNQNADAVDYQLRLASDDSFRQWANSAR